MKPDGISNVRQQKSAEALYQIQSGFVAPGD